MKLLNLERVCLVYAVIFHDPSVEGKLDELLFGQTVLVKQVGQRSRTLFPADRQVRPRPLVL